MGQVRIIDRLADTQLVSGDYVLVDSQTEGTRKFDLGTFANTTNTTISNIESTIGNTPISTTVPTVTGAIAEHENEINILNNKYTYELVTFSGGSVAGGSRKTITVDVTKNGYIPIAIIGFTLNSTEVFALGRHMINNNIASLTVINTYTEARDANGSIYVLYQNDGSSGGGGDSGGGSATTADIVIRGVGTPKCKIVQFDLPSSVLISPDTNASLLSHYNLKSSTATDLFTGDTLSDLFRDSTILAATGLWCNNGAIICDILIWPEDQTLSLSAKNAYSNANVTVSSARILVFYVDSNDDTSEVIGDTDISEVGDGTFTGGLADHEDRLDDISEVIGNASMGTTATTLTGAIAEHESDITSLNSSINNITYFNCTDAGSYYDIVRQNCYAIGKRVFISVELVVTSANPPTSAELCVVPAGYRPASALNNKGFVYHLRSSGGDVWSDLRPALVSIATTGAVKQSLSSAFPLNEVVVIWAEYMCA